MSSLDTLGIDDMLEKQKNHQVEYKTRQCEIHGEYQSSSMFLFTSVRWSGCNQCEAEDKAREQAKADAEEHERLCKQRKAAGIPKRYWGIDLENFGATQNQQVSLNAARKFVDNFDDNVSQTLIYGGTVGTGKTRLVSAIMQTLGFGRYIRAIDISREVRSAYGNNEKSEVDVINRFVDERLLVIDEVGVQSGTESEKLLVTDIIDRRYADMKSTIICSNLTTDELRQTFGERAWDRIRQECFYSPMTGHSMRVKQ